MSRKGLTKKQMLFVARKQARESLNPLGLGVRINKYPNETKWIVVIETGLLNQQIERIFNTLEGLLVYIRALTDLIEISKSQFKKETSLFPH